MKLKDAFDTSRGTVREALRVLKGILAEIETLIETGPTEWETIHDNIHTYFHKYLPFSRELLDQDYQDLCKILAALEKQDGDEAKRVARKHVARFSRLMAEQQCNPGAAQEDDGI